MADEGTFEAVGNTLFEVAAEEVEEGDVAGGVEVLGVPVSLLVIISLLRGCS